MDNKELRKLEEKVNYIQDEFMLGDRQAILCRDGNSAIEAMRNGDIPGFVWTQEHEKDYQADKLNKLL